MLRALIAGVFACFAASVSAQSWQSSTQDSGALIHGRAFTFDRYVTFSCTAPSPSGRALIETGDHEALRTDTPFDLAVSLSIDFLDPFGRSQVLPAPALVLDGVRYALPALEYSDAGSA